MADKLSKKITVYLCRNDIISESEKPFYAYGLSYLFDNIFFFLYILLIGGIFQHLLNALLLWILLFVLRSTCGGIHASTKLRCAIFSYGIPPFIFAVLHFFPISAFTYSLLLVLSCLILAALAPVGNERKILIGTHRKRLRHTALLSLCLILVLYLLFMHLGHPYPCGIIALSVTLVSISVLLGFLKQQ